ncbi:methyltransferase [Rhodococcus aerolatus]
MLLLRAPGVYPPQRDTWLVADLLRPLSPGARVLDVCTGTGALAVTAARAGARATAVDISGRAVATARTNAALHRVPLRVLRGDLTGPVAGEQFDVVVSNPPYVPAATDELPVHGRLRAFDGGRDGRTLLDRVLDAAPAVLAPGGTLLVVHSGLCGVDESLARLRRRGLAAEVAAQCLHPFGPELTRRAEMFEQRGLIAPGERTERLVVLRATAPVPAAAAQVPAAG